MQLVATLIEWSKSTYGGLPLIVLINLLQLSNFVWVVYEAWRTRWETQRLDRPVLKIRAAQRAEMWKQRVRPMVITLMLLGPGLGLAMSTLLGAIGMGSLGDAMGSQIDQQALLTQIGLAYREISYAYLLMVGGTAPMLLGPIAILIARRLELAAEDALGGDREDRMLCAVERIVELLEERGDTTKSSRENGHARAH
jgi:hypothetical protein